MGEEFVKVLGPWPILQLIFGLIVFGLGVWFIIRGVTGKDDKQSIDDRRDRWEAYNRLENIEENTREMRETNRKILEAIQHLTSVMWNRSQP